MLCLYLPMSPLLWQTDFLTSINVNVTCAVLVKGSIFEPVTLLQFDLVSL